jgi:hypothetical protein
VRGRGLPAEHRAEHRPSLIAGRAGLRVRSIPCECLSPYVISIHS